MDFSYNAYIEALNKPHYLQTRADAAVIDLWQIGTVLVVVAFLVALMYLCTGICALAHKLSKKAQGRK